MGWPALKSELTGKTTFAFCGAKGVSPQARIPNTVKRDEIKGLNCKKVLADFSEVSDVGSTGIGFIVGVYTSTKNSGGQFILAGLRPRVREVFDVTHVSTVIPLAADIASGLAILCEESLDPGGQSEVNGFGPRATDHASGGIGAARRRKTWD